MPADSSVQQRFSTRAGLLLSALGIAVGTGNIWRFPRIAAQNGGDEGAGALILAWVIFLFLWSVPLIIAEYVIGRKYRFGVVGSFVKGMGKRFAWMGAFVVFVATAISFFYAIIVGWALVLFLSNAFLPPSGEYPRSNHCLGSTSSKACGPLPCTSWRWHWAHW
jgi:neurotransmitter:Na+ symporter, NSS family